MLAILAKAPNTGKARLERLLARYEQSVRDAFKDFLLGVRDKNVVDHLSHLVEIGDVEGALAIVETHVARLANVVPRIITDAGGEEAARLAAQIGRSGLSAAIGFDPTYPRAAELMRTQRLDFIQAFTRGQREAVRTAVDRSLSTGTGPRAAARAFRGAIGLTPRQEEAVANFRRRLESGQRDMLGRVSALTRDLRDRRFDPTILRAVERGERLTPAQIDRMTERYRERMLILRSETIARTEGGRALSLANEEAARQVVSDAGFSPDRVRRVWRATGDGRTRDAHAWMDGQEVGLDEPFVDGYGNELMYPGDPAAPPETTINCRCVVVTEFAPPQ